uniref:Uncharacterized protein n=1 Tax=Marseillevirus sp. TaxID=2809551 RepID=A0AA96EP57_9VIRU|nr:hypothetical protein MarFTMF_152 [Marseillevirus sp.]
MNNIFYTIKYIQKSERIFSCLGKRKKMECGKKGQKLLLEHIKDYETPIVKRLWGESPTQ